MKLFPVTLDAKIGDLASAHLSVGDADKDGRADLSGQLKLGPFTHDLKPQNVDAAAVAQSVLGAVLDLWALVTGGRK